MATSQSVGATQRSAMEADDVHAAPAQHNDDVPRQATHNTTNTTSGAPGSDMNDDVHAAGPLPQQAEGSTEAAVPTIKVKKSSAEKKKAKKATISSNKLKKATAEATKPVITTGETVIKALGAWSDPLANKLLAKGLSKEALAPAPAKVANTPFAVQPQWVAPDTAELMVPINPLVAKAAGLAVNSMPRLPRDLAVATAPTYITVGKLPWMDAKSMYDGETGLRRQALERAEFVLVVRCGLRPPQIFLTNIGPEKNPLALEQRTKFVEAFVNADPTAVAPDEAICVLHGTKEDLFANADKVILRGSVGESRRGVIYEALGYPRPGATAQILVASMWALASPDAAARRARLRLKKGVSVDAAFAAALEMQSLSFVAGVAVVGGDVRLVLEEPWQSTQRTRVTEYDVCRTLFTDVRIRRCLPAPADTPAMAIVDEPTAVPSGTALVHVDVALGSNGVRPSWEALAAQLGGKVVGPHNHLSCKLMLPLDTAATVDGCVLDGLAFWRGGALGF
jgi:hypothetical protein